MQDLYSTDPTQKIYPRAAGDHADYRDPARQHHELDHTDQEYLPCLEDLDQEVGIDHTNHTDHTDHLSVLCVIPFTAGKPLLHYTSLYPKSSLQYY